MKAIKTLVQAFISCRLDYWVGTGYVVNHKIQHVPFLPREVHRYRVAGCIISIRPTYSCADALTNLFTYLHSWLGEYKTGNISETVEDRAKVSISGLYSRTRAFDCRQNVWPWMTSVLRLLQFSARDAVSRAPLKMSRRHQRYNRRILSLLTNLHRPIPRIMRRFLWYRGGLVNFVALRRVGVADRSQVYRLRATHVDPEWPNMSRMHCTITVQLHTSNFFSWTELSKWIRHLK